MIRCGRPRWDAKDKICDWEGAKKRDICQPEGDKKNVYVPQAQARPQTQTQTLKQTGEPALKKTEAELALERLLAERKKLDNFWSQPGQ